jgi:hypothetical protein
MRAVTRCNPGIVMGEIGDALERHAKPLGDELSKARFMPCPEDIVHDQLDPAFRKHGDLGTLAVRAAGEFDIIGDANAAQLAAFPSLRAPGRKSIPIGQRQRHVHCIFVTAAVVGDAKRVGMGLDRGRFAPIWRVVGLASMIIQFTFCAVSALGDALSARARRVTVGCASVRLTASSAEGHWGRRPV